MRLATIVTCLLLAFSAPLTLAAETKAQVAEDKAQVLEQKAAVQPDAPPAPKSKAITQTEVQAVDPAGQAALDDAITCMARSIYWESKGGKAPDMEAVASVVMNRLGHEGFPDTVCGVVKQGKETGHCQFSWWCDGRSDSVQEETRYALAKEIARKALNRQLDDRTKGALYFHDRHVSPDWARAYVKTTETGDFLFYKPRNGTAR
ncbi:cell wall hydrolase [Pseudomonas alkylphenolica]|uniref:cell wall hydrolase n=1 Tax=Pseudomonas alkylphenolica TaxID=237609 RepID=UPI0018D6A83F|nr:cell wall hydrolase [Pseudomonas alkylphenolica]MBH3431266.1 cell wall hydrolase [Pseudomonas alkylphenolica]